MEHKELELELSHSRTSAMSPMMCNDRPFYMVVLVDYSVAGLRIVDVVRSRRMLVVCRGNCVLSSSRHNGGGPSGDT